MTNIVIDTEKLKSEISKIKDVNKNLETILDHIKSDNELLKDFWETETSESVLRFFMKNSMT